LKEKKEAIVVKTKLNKLSCSESKFELYNESVIKTLGVILKNNNS